MEGREFVRQQLNALQEGAEQSFGFTDWFLQLETIFPYVTSLEELLPRVNEKKLDLIAWLYQAITPEEQNETRNAVLYLYPFLKHVPIDAFEKPTYKQARAYFILWAVLASEEFRAVMDSLMNLDLTRLDRIFLPRFSDTPKDTKWRAIEISNVLMMLRQAREGVDLVQKNKPVYIPSLIELEGIVEQRLEWNPAKLYYDEARRILVSIDPCNSIEDVLTQVGKIIVEEHEKMSQTYETGWSKEEREFYGEAFITSSHPKHEFEFDRHYHDCFIIAKKQTFLDNSFRALLYYELLQKGLSGPEIGKKFFKMDWATPNDSNYGIAKKEASKRKRHAKELIDRAFAGLHF